MRVGRGVACYRKCCRRHLLPCPPAQQTRARPPAVLCPLLPPPRSWNPPVVVRSRRCPGPEHATTSLRPDEACGRREGRRKGGGQTFTAYQGRLSTSKCKPGAHPHAAAGHRTSSLSESKGSSRSCVSAMAWEVPPRHHACGPRRRLGSRRKGPVTCCSGQLLRQTARSKEASGRKEQPSLGVAVVVPARTCCLGGKPATPGEGGEIVL